MCVSLFNVMYIRLRLHISIIRISLRLNEVKKPFDLLSHLSSRTTCIRFIGRGENLNFMKHSFFISRRFSSFMPE